MPWSLRLPIAFLFFMAMGKLALALWTCARVETISQRVIIDAVLHGLLGLIALLLAIHLLLRLPFGRAFAIGFLCALPLFKALRYALDPVRWHIAGIHRFQDIISAAVLIGLAFLLLGQDAAAYFSQAPEKPPPPPQEGA
ncbi:MAG TPA: hypothetical protein DCM87_18725 [Planctomycetes bacterium]|nr:hypothetical protein [Planctomycetota bacterium]